MMEIQGFNLKYLACLQSNELSSLTRSLKVLASSQKPSTPTHAPPEPDLQAQAQAHAQAQAQAQVQAQTDYPIPTAAARAGTNTVLGGKLATVNPHCLQTHLLPH